MVKVIAVTAVTLCVEPGEKNMLGKVTKPAKTEEKHPGSVFDLSKTDFEDLAPTGAVRPATPAEIAAAGASAGSKKVTAAELAKMEKAVADLRSRAGAAADPAKAELLAEADKIEAELTALRG